MNYAAILSFINKYKWIILTIIIIIVLFIVIRRNWWKLKTKFAPRDIDLETGESLQIPEARKNALESLARKLYDDIYDTSFWTGHDGDLYKQADALTDNELLYLAKFYKRNLTLGNSLYSDIDSQWYPFAGGVTELMTHLAKIGEY